MLIGVPYLVWSAVYWAQHGGGPGALAVRLATGTAEYHLYFLLVSMQVYLVFPLLLRLVRATAGRHGRLFAASAALQLATFWVLHDVAPGWRWLRYAEQLLPSYQLYVVAGALAAAHLRRCQNWVLGHRRAIVVGVVVATLATEAAYLAQVATGSSPARASEVLQPVMVPWTLVLTAGLLVAGLTYARRRRPGLLADAVQEGSQISFGVFLVHPLVITGLLAGWPGTVFGRLPDPVSYAALWLATVVVSVAAAEVGARSPASLALTGRRSTRRHRWGRRRPGVLSSRVLEGARR